MKVGICTLGCKVNTYESEYVINELKKAKYTISDFDSINDVYIINTCTVTNTSDSKSRKMIRHARKLNPDAHPENQVHLTIKIKKNNAELMDIA